MYGNKNYDMRICSCGKIHMIPQKVEDEAMEVNKTVLLICGGCGTATAIIPDTYMGGKSRNIVDLKEDAMDISPENFSVHSRDGELPLYHVYYSAGIPVPMMTGNAAKSYFGNTFYDSTAPYFGELLCPGAKAEDIQKFIRDWVHKSQTVNMSRFIRNTPKEYLEVISQRYINAFDWEGTEYERKED